MVALLGADHGRFVPPVEMTWKDYLQTAEGYHELGLQIDANDELEKIAPEDRLRPEIFRLRFEIYASLEKWDLANVAAAHLVKIYPENPRHWLSLATAATHTVGAPEAEAVLQRAVVAHTKHAGVWYAMAGLASQAGRLDDARSLLEHALRLEPNLRLKALDDPAIRPIWDEMARLR
jgi:tetratricopeptide (TPR) repeat protein